VGRTSCQAGSAVVLQKKEKNGSIYLLKVMSSQFALDTKVLEIEL
jgi:hypothetical protein